MGREISANRNQTFLLPMNLDDFIHKNHPARFINQFVDLMDFDTLGLKPRKSQTGRPYYSDKMLLKIWLYSYFNKIRSTRDIERLCHNDMGMLWLTGMNYPDHNTIWRFFKLNKESLRNVFKQSVKTAFDLGMYSLALTAVDGTKIIADVSRSKTVSKEYLKKILKILDNSIDDAFTLIEKQRKSYRNNSEYLLNKLHDSQELRDKILSSLQSMEEKSSNFHNDIDSDSKMMKLSDNRKVMGYNAQAMVDSDSGIIVSSTVSVDQSDNELLCPVIEDSIEITGTKPPLVLADAGYYSGNQLQKAEDLAINALVNITRSNKPGHNNNPDWEYHISKFEYNSSTDSYICPAGSHLLFSGKTKYKKNGKAKVYRCFDYETCPYVTDCSKAFKSRGIEVMLHRDVINRHIKKMEITENKELLKRRKTIVEPIFGYIKWILGFTRFTVRGLKNVEAQWELICTTVNLRKLYKKWSLAA